MSKGVEYPKTSLAYILFKNRFPKLPSGFSKVHLKNFSKVFSKICLRFF